MDGGLAGPMNGGRGGVPGGRFKAEDGIEPEETGRTPPGPAIAGLPVTFGTGPETGLCERPGRTVLTAGLGAEIVAGFGGGAGRGVETDWGRFDTKGDGRVGGGL